MRRWTDGKSWSASRVSGSFLTYREMEGKRGSSSFGTPGTRTTKTPESGPGDDPADGEEGPDGYRYKPDGLMKQSFSITTSQGQHLHLISYFSRSSPTSQVLRQPSQDPQLASIQPAKGMYPESTVNDQSTVPAVTRSPMPGAPNYAMAPSPVYGRAAPHHHPYLPPGYVPHPAYMAYPMSPMHTPPPYALHYPHGMPLGYPAPPYAAPPPPPHLPINHAPPSSYDQRPTRLSESLARSSPSGLSQPIPAPYTQSQPPPPVTQPYPASYSITATTSSLPESSEARSGSGFQIDPRLTSPPSAPSAPPTDSAPSAPTPTATENTAAAPTPVPAPSHGSSFVSVTASQAPTINALVHEANRQQSDGRAQNGSEAERQGSASPGGASAPPQDIPSEKLGFREDKRALSMLDRAFARV
jgi:Gti1/Pac2 family transcription factor